MGPPHWRCASRRSNESIWSGGIEAVAAGTAASNTSVNAGTMAVEGTASGTNLGNVLAAVALTKGISGCGSQLVGVPARGPATTYHLDGGEVLVLPEPASRDVMCALLG